MVTKPTFLSLFAGIGGIDLGLERSGFQCVGQVEWDEWCSQILTKHWPEVPKFRDIKEVTDAQLRSLGPIDLVAGGFPCQPVSVAGRQKAQEDDRWLWPEFARVIRTVRPRVVFVENVPGLLTTNAGEAFSEVQGDLAALGYDSEWTVIPAQAFGAHHLRKRVALVAYSHGSELWEQSRRSGGTDRESAPLPTEHGETQSLAYSDRLGWSGRSRDFGTPRWNEFGDSGSSPLANTDSQRSSRSGLHEGQRREALSDLDGGSERVFWRTPRHSEIWTTEPDVGRVANGVPRRMDRLRGLGNAVVPQFAEYVGNCIQESFFQDVA